MVDAVCLGDGVSWLQEILRRPKRNSLHTIAAKVEGTYVPSLYHHEYRDGRLAEIKPADDSLPFPVRHLVDDQDAWINDYDGAYIPFSEEETEEIA